MKNSILIAIDMFEKNEAAQKKSIHSALFLSKQMKASIEAVGIVSPDRIHAPTNFDHNELDSYRKAGLDFLKKLLKRFGIQQLDCDVVVQPLNSSTRSVEMLLEHAAAEKASALAVSTHLKSKPNFTLHGSFISQLIERAEIPVLVFNSKAPHLNAKVRRVLFATDFSRASKAALEEAVKWCAGLHAELVIYSVTYGMPSYAIGSEFVAGGLGHIDQFLEKQRVAVNRSGKKYLKVANDKAVSATLKIVESGFGQVPEMILATAKKEKCDLIFLHSNATARGSLIFGSTTRDVLKKSLLPVVVVP